MKKKLKQLERRFIGWANAEENMNDVLVSDLREAQVAVEKWRREVQYLCEQNRGLRERIVELEAQLVRVARATTSEVGPGYCTECGEPRGLDGSCGCGGE